MKAQRLIVVRLGWRNLWRFSFDRVTGDMYFGDVGEDVREEISFQPAGSPGGENYGWPMMEGSIVHRTNVQCIERACSA